jgi:hypothetical protein
MTTEIDYKKVWPYVVHHSKPHDIFIARPSIWGNPYSHKPSTLAKYKVESGEEALTKYEEMVRSDPEMMAKIKGELKDKVLGCYCVPRKCHGHILAWIANFEED